MDAPQNGRAGRSIKYVVIGLVVLLVLLGIFFVREYRTLRREQIINARELWLSSVLQHHGPLGANDVGVVRTWMTFDYVNKLFSLPPDYLKTQLSITDARYPKLSLSAYAEAIHANATTIVTGVEAAIRGHLATSTAPTST